MSLMIIVSRLIFAIAEIILPYKEKKTIKIIFYYCLLFNDLFFKYLIIFYFI